MPGTIRRAHSKAASGLQHMAGGSTGSLHGALVQAHLLLHPPLLPPLSSMCSVPHHRRYQPKTGRATHRLHGPPCPGPPPSSTSKQQVLSPTASQVSKKDEPLTASMAPLSRPSDSSGSCSHTNCRGGVPGASIKCGGTSPTVDVQSKRKCGGASPAVHARAHKLQAGAEPGRRQSGGCCEWQAHTAGVQGRLMLNSRHCDRTGVMLRRYRRSPPGAQYPLPHARCAAPPRHSACWTAGCRGQGGAQPKGDLREGHGPPPASKSRRATCNQV